MRLRIIQLDPTNVQARIDGAESALKFRKITIAQNLLARPTAEMQKFTRYYDLLGWLQILSHDLQDANATWMNALEHNPGNIIFETNLATVRLSSSDESVRKEAVNKLEQIVFGEKPPVSALVSLMVYAIQSPDKPKDIDRWLERFRTLVPQTDPLFTNYLDTLRRWSPDRFAEELASYQVVVLPVPAAAMHAQSWMISSGLFKEFCDFRQSLPEPLRDNIQSILLQAEALFNLDRKDELNRLLEQPVFMQMLPLKMAWQEPPDRR